MSPTEQTLRAAFSWALFQDEHGIIKHHGPFDWVPDGRIKLKGRATDCPHLRWESDGRIVTVSTSPAGRVLHYAETYADHSMWLEMILPREFWAQSAVKESLTARPVAERRGYIDLGDTGSADEVSES